VRSTSAERPVSPGPASIGDVIKYRIDQIEDERKAFRDYVTKAQRFTQRDAAASRQSQSTRRTDRRDHDQSDANSCGDRRGAVPALHGDAPGEGPIAHPPTDERDCTMNGRDQPRPVK
jgi:hypothetical protein